LYILPKFVQAKSQSEFRSIVFEFYKKILPLFGLGLILLFVLREYLVLLVFSNDFIEVTTILGWQMIADFLRVLALVMVIQFHAKKMVWHYILTDLFLAIALYVSAMLGLKYLELSGVVIGHVITYAVYFVVILVIFRKSTFR
jgi:PST family polysaccharide transporter